MGPKHIHSNIFSLFIVKFKKLGFSAPLWQIFVICCSQFLKIKSIKLNLYFTRLIRFRVSRVSGAHLRDLRQGPFSPYSSLHQWRVAVYIVYAGNVW